MSNQWQFNSAIPSGVAPESDESQRVQPAASYGEYQILGELGQGGMASVYRAVDRMGREVAIKILDRTHGAAIQRFQREGQLVAGMRHPGIVQVLRLDADERGRPFLVYELVDEGAEDFSQALTTGSVERRLDLIAGVAEAIAYAHRQGVTHRDLKPANVLLDASGQPRVTDFGLATAAGLERLTRTGAMVGTPMWMAPEQIAGLREEQGPATDVWALGVLLYQALTGELPFEGTHLHELAAAITISTPRAPRVREPSVTRALEETCLRCLQRDPGRRYANGGEFVDALREARRSAPVPARRPRWLAVVAVLLTALGGAAAGRLTLDAHPDPKAPPESAAESAAERRFESEFSEASRLIAAGSFEEASHLVDRLVQEAPQAARAWGLLGRLHLEGRRYAEAVKAYRQAISLEASASLWTDMALVHEDWERDEEALQGVGRALALDPDCVRAISVKTRVLYRRGDLADAEVAVRRLLRLDPNHSGGLNVRGLLHLGRREFRRALKDFERSLAGQQSPSGLANRGLALLELGQFERGVRDLEESQRLDPKSPQPYNSLAIGYSRQGDHEQALGWIDRCLEVAPDLAHAHSHRGVILARMKRFDEAKVSARRALQLSTPGTPARKQAEDFLRQLER